MDLKSEAIELKENAGGMVCKKPEI